LKCARLANIDARQRAAAIDDAPDGALTSTSVNLAFDTIVTHSL
jgi:hypothetical protein